MKRLILVVLFISGFGAGTGQTTCIRARKRLRRYDHLRLRRRRKALGSLGLEVDR
jgi:hypothetical protein